MKEVKTPKKPLAISTELLLLLSLLTNRNVECLKKYGQIFLTVS